MKKHTSALPLAIVSVVLFLSTVASAQYTETTLYSFGGVTHDAINPSTALIRDAAGNLYGTTGGGGIGGGTVYELSPTTGGGWTETVIYDFGSTNGDALEPTGSLILDADGNLYGVTHSGGASNKGAVYELSPSGGGWTESVIYSFAGNPDVQNPSGSLTFDSAGNLYGTSQEGGGSTNSNCFDGCGTVFELSPSSGGWTEKLIYAFSGGADGIDPTGNLLIDADGKVYGTAAAGGTFAENCNGGCGTVFRLTLASGTWRFARLFNFQGTNGGSGPIGLAFDAAYNLYGPATAGGTGCATSLGCGAIYKLTRQTSPGPWKEIVLHNFTQKYDGAVPAGVILDPAGNIFGAASVGGNGNIGTVWELSPTAHGPWKLTQLYSFGTGANGGNPDAGVIRDPCGNLYGTTRAYGQFNHGTVFELSPP